MRPILPVALVGLLGAPLAGCSALPVSAGYTSETSMFDQPLPMDVEAFRQGASDSEVLDVLGPPAAVTALPDGYAFLYEGGRLISESVGASVFSFRAGYAWSAKDLTAAALVFDDGGRLTAMAVERAEGGTGRGAAIGIQRSQAADQAAYLAPPPQRLWGAQMLRRIPRTLNHDNNPDSGQSGLERRGTTTKVGQRTLESGYVTALSLLDFLKVQTGN